MLKSVGGFVKGISTCVGIGDTFRCEFISTIETRPDSTTALHRRSQNSTTAKVVMFSKTIILALFASVALAVPVENESPYPNALTARDASVRCSSQNGGFGRSADLNTCLDQIIANRK